MRVGLGALLLEAASEVSERAWASVSAKEPHEDGKLTIRRSGNLLELDSVDTLPEHRRHHGYARLLLFAHLLLVYGTVDGQIQGQDLIIHGELKVPICRLRLERCSV